MEVMHYQSLCDAIIQRCAAQQWYGPDFWGPPHTSEVHDACRRDFEFAPATEKQVRETEELLGFALPAVLRALYTRIANGGFGPAYGFRGIQGGNPQRGGTILEFFSHVDTTFFSLKDDDVQPEKAGFFPYERRPRSLVPLIDWGCGSDVSLDCTSGHVLQYNIWDDKSYQLVYMADSLENWLHRWLRGDLYADT
jgi:hypothetical protein